MAVPSAVTAFLLLASLLLGGSTEGAAEPRYVLPYPVGSRYELLQGYNGPWGHEGAAAYAYDFDMPIGSAVTAARAGTVVKVEASHPDATRKPGEENFVFVDHGDGTFSRYYHLTKGGVRVAVGERVVPGQEIGRSGDSGASAGPHLHFDVTRDCAEWGCQTVPIAFANAAENPLLPGREYEALADPVRRSRGRRPRSDDARAVGRRSKAVASGDSDAPGQHRTRPLLASSGPLGPPARED